MIIDQGVNNHQQINHQQPAIKRGSIVGKALSYSATIGTMAGVAVGWYQRISENMLPDFKSKALCVTKFNSPIMQTMNAGMQAYIKTGLKYVIPGVSIALLTVPPVVRGINAWRSEGGDKSLVRHIVDAGKTVSWSKVALAASLVGLAMVTGANRSFWISNLPFINSDNPSGHTMMQATLGIANGLAGQAASESGWKKMSLLINVAALGIGIANVVFLGNTSYACHTVLEVVEGIEWAATLVAVSYVAVKIIGMMMPRADAAKVAIDQALARYDTMIKQFKSNHQDNLPIEMTREGLGRVKPENREYHDFHEVYGSQVVAASDLSGYHRILPNLFLGNGQSPDFVGQMKVKNVLSLIKSGGAFNVPAGINHIITEVHDCASRENYLKLDELADTIKQGVDNGGILVHCSMGASRSATAVLAYLIKYHNLDLEQALAVARDTRTLVQPNAGFIMSLSVFELAKSNNLPQNEAVDIFDSALEDQFPQN